MKYSSINGRHVSAKTWAETLAGLDPERKISGKIVYDDTVVQDNEPTGKDETPW